MFVAKQRQVPVWLSGALVAGAFGVLWLLERRRPLRREVEPKSKHDARNLLVAATAAFTLQLVERPLAERLTTLVEKRRWGLVKLLRLPLWLEAMLAVLLMDYTLYVWHVLTHRVPFLWRFHVAHHVDLALDASTAVRFHFGELALATIWRAGQVLIIGVSPLSFSIWQTCLLLSVLFHHSNVELPYALERRLNHLLVTPRMHGIHHSIIREETDSNWSSGLTIWDRLHGTLRLNVPQAGVVIGVPAYREPTEVGLTNVLLMPFKEQRETWEFPGGERPERELQPAAPPTRLLP